jgi:predicted phage tail protein
VEPSNFYTTSIVVAEDSVSMTTYGEKAVDVIAFGCTNASQATRYAKWILDSESKNKTVITYTGGLDHYNLLPGQIVEFHDSNEHRDRRGGRIVSQSGTAVVLDAASNAVAGDYFSLTLSDGTVHQTTISTISGVNVVLVAAPAVSALAYATWIAMPLAFGHRLYKVIKIDEKSNSQFNVTIQLFDTNKFA